MENLPPGFRFYPTEEELVSFYLKNKLRGTRIPDLDRLVPVLDIYDYNPVDLPRLAGERCPADGDQWFFFIPRHEREARGGRPTRLTTHGYWKATGSPGDVYSAQNRVIGRKRTMVFYVGRAPSGVKTEWKMNEYKAVDSHEQKASSSSTVANPQLQLREEFSLCRIYTRSSTMRALDRRPAADPSDQSTMNQRNYEAAATLTYSQMNNIPAVILPEITDSRSLILDASSSGDRTSNPSGQCENYNTDIATDSGCFWDSEDFSWFDI